MTSSISSLAVPTDIPWRRICVTGDMLDPEPCDLVVPPRWRSSIAVFRHDPPDEFQPLPHSRVSYLKVCVTLAPFAPELEVKLGRRAADVLEEAFPCHGALLHVTVAPPEDARDGDRRDFPYFADFEPKKRELYEMVSETGEVLSGSSSTLSVGKSSASTQSTENYNIDNGWNFGTSFTYAGTGGGGQVGVQKTEGTIQSAGYQTSNINTRDESTERRELMSHTTQLAQMYNLFQAFHVGTNRALFLMEPRPHIRQSEATFINGPRALEGIQEVFLAVVRPREMDGFCVGALLETAHLGKEPVLEHETSTRVVEFRLAAKAPNLDTSIGKDSGEGKKSHIVHFDAPKGWEIAGYQTTTLRGERVTKGPTVAHDGQHLSITGEVSWRFEEGKIKAGEREDIYHDGALDVDVVVKLRRKEAEVKEYVRSLLARPGAPDILRWMGLRPKLLLAAFLTACGAPNQQVATSTGITTVQPGESSGESSGSTGSSSSSGGTVENSTGTSTGSTSAAPPPDMPGFETLGPVEGCGKIDILFVINDGGDIEGPEPKKINTYDALSIRNGTIAFLAAMQEQASEYDLQVMTVKGDPEWRGTNGPSNCCVPDKPCDELGPFPCDPPFGLANDCDYTLGAGVRYPAGFMASNQDCELAGGRRYLTEAQDDFAGTFECILNVGQTGRGGQKHLGAMVQAVGPTLNAPLGCNEGFLRPDAMLVVVILTAYADTDSPGTPEGLAASLIAAKDGYAGGIVVVGVLNTIDYNDEDYCGDDPDDRTRKFVEGFPNHVLGSYCAPDIGVNLVQAVDVILETCAEFTPPG